MKIIISFLFFFSVLLAQPKQVSVGADVLLSSKLELIDGKNIAVVTNHSAILNSGEHLIDALVNIPTIKIVALFGPEHGIRGNASAGEHVINSIDEITGVPIFSLYGETKKPTKEMLTNVEILIFDMQDVGARYYTYLSTMILVMEAAAENKIPIIILDRPNPIRGTKIDGPIRLDSLKSFVAWLAVPIIHGMTFGEIAKMANEKNWLANGLKADLKIIEIEGWRRALWFDEMNLKWTAPSPNIKTLNSAIIYPGTCLMEGTNISEGRGTENPFEIIGAPWLDSKKLISDLYQSNLLGVKFKEMNFTPQSIANIAPNPKYKNEICSGIFIEVTNRNIFEPIKTEIAILISIYKNHPDKFEFKEKGFDRLAGTPIIRQEILKGKNLTQICLRWKSEVDKFAKERKKYLIYND